MSRAAQSIVLVPAVARDSHARERVVAFDELDVVQCTCGRMFDETRFAAHLEREAAR